MKMKDIISEEEAKAIQEEECLVCETHVRAQEKLDENFVECPCCSNFNSMKQQDAGIVVGEANYYNPEHHICKATVFRCSSCGNYFALLPEKIIWNANHDIYYTGGRDYINDTEFHKAVEAIKKDIHENVESYTNRIKARESLDPWNLETWIGHKIEHRIAEFLHSKGLKK